MGISGSVTAKATIHPSLHKFTLWNAEDMRMLYMRSQHQLAETFSLRIHEFEFLLGDNRLINHDILVALFDTIFDTDKNKMVDKLEVLCLICLVSSVSNKEKLEILFDIFNFNDKGYLIKSDFSLMVLCIVNAVYKADNLIKQPPRAVLEDLLHEAYSRYALSDKEKLRKPELLMFASNTKDVQLYLEAWRGHASQVFLGENQLWRDYYFAANEMSIIPTADWAFIGLPPGDFIRWRRRKNVGQLGCMSLFTHIVSYMKNTEKRQLYSGNGVVAGGRLKQGLLADRWLINGIAACLSSPDVLLYSFANTGQEDIGRYCVRVYEGGGWRSVFIDDRIPCSHDCLPIFLRSTDSEECWPMVLQKGYAKYLGSYGHVGICGTRHDASFYSLRLMTGGHVFKLFIPSYSWLSNSQGADNSDGFQLISSYIEEGSIVSLGRSQSLVMNKSTLKQSPRAAPPHGYLFPLVFTSTDKNGYKFITLKDPHGVMSTCEYTKCVPDGITGHCRIFRVAVEDVSTLFDTLVVSRFPDSRRLVTDKLRLKAWQTEVVAAVTEGVQFPAKFRLVVHGKCNDATAAEDKVNKLAGQALMKAKDLESERQQSRGKSSFSTYSKQAGVQQRKADVVDVVQDYVSLIFTAQSAVDWVVAGSENVRAKTRVRFVPDADTCEAILMQRRKEEALQRKKRRKAEIEEAMRLQILRSIGTANTEGGDVTASAIGVGVDDTEEVEVVQQFISIRDGVASTANATSNATGNSAASASYPIPSGAHINSDAHVVDETHFYTDLSAQQSWLSGSVDLWPGTYKIYADTSFGCSASNLAALMKPTDTNDAPWMAGVDITTQLKTWLQMTSNAGKFDLYADGSADAAIPCVTSDLTDVQVPVNTWPFMSETQAEASSVGLVRMLSQLREDAAVCGAHLVTESKKFMRVYSEQEIEYFRRREQEEAMQLAKQKVMTSKHKKKKVVTDTTATVTATDGDSVTVTSTDVDADLDNTNTNTDDGGGIDDTPTAAVESVDELLPGNVDVGEEATPSVIGEGIGTVAGTASAAVDTKIAADNDDDDGDDDDDVVGNDAEGGDTMAITNASATVPANGNVEKSESAAETSVDLQGSSDDFLYTEKG